MLFPAASFDWLHKMTYKNSRNIVQIIAVVWTIVHYLWIWEEHGVGNYLVFRIFAIINVPIEIFAKFLPFPHHYDCKYLCSHFRVMKRAPANLFENSDLTSSHVSFEQSFHSFITMIPDMIWILCFFFKFNSSIFACSPNPSTFVS